MIDTHALIWYIEGNKKLKKKAVSAIEKTENTVYVSKASLWEMAIKISLGKLEMSIPFDELEVYLEKNEFSILEIEILPVPGFNEKGKEEKAGEVDFFSQLCKFSPVPVFYTT